MSKRESIVRYNIIIKKLRKQAASFAEISHCLALESEIQGYNFSVSKRTFQRDLEDIRAIYNIDIQFNYSKKTYFIDDDGNPEVNERILEAFDTFYALNLTERLSNYIHFEKRRPQGTENLQSLLYAIQHGIQIRFTYEKFYECEIISKSTEPYALKEFKNRWYLMAKDLVDNRIKTFAIDRLTDLEITKAKFQLPVEFNVKEYFKYCFGIFSPSDSVPEEVILSFSETQGKYIKSLPLHESQVILADNENELLIKLTLFVTYDFIMEMFSYGQDVKVIKPESLIYKIKTTSEKVLKLYS